MVVATRSAREWIEELVFKPKARVVAWTRYRNLKTHLKYREDKMELMTMPMKSINPATNKARINTQIGKMTGPLVVLAKLSNEMSMSKNLG